jgi:hypothetical protein
MSKRSPEWKEKRDRTIKERLPSVIQTLEKAGVKDFKITDFSVVLEINTRRVEFFIFTGVIIWEGKNPETLGKGIRCLVDMIKKEKNKSSLDAYYDN